MPWQCVLPPPARLTVAEGFLGFRFLPKFQSFSSLGLEKYALSLGTVCARAMGPGVADDPVRHPIG